MTSSAAWTRIEERANRKPEPGKRHWWEHAEVRELILSARQQIGQTINAGLTSTSVKTDDERGVRIAGDSSGTQMERMKRSEEYLDQLTKGKEPGKVGNMLE